MSEPKQTQKKKTNRKMSMQLLIHVIEWEKLRCRIKNDALFSLCSCSKRATTNFFFLNHVQCVSYNEFCIYLSIHLAKRETNVRENNKEKQNSNTHEKFGDNEY